MQCPFCGHPESRVVDTRDSGRSIRRRRQCQQCGRRFTTYEEVAHTLMVVKNDGRREPYSREKVLRGVRLACVKRPIPAEVVEGIVNQVEDQLFQLGRAEVPSKLIGQLVLDRLRQVDPVAYIRFASVYLRVPDLESLRREIDRLLASESA